jgi:hypothetical protein
MDHMDHTDHTEYMDARPFSMLDCFEQQRGTQGAQEGFVCGINPTAGVGDEAHPDAQRE